MGRGTSGSEILKEIVEKKGGKIWVAKRIGRRISYIDGLKAGKEMFIPYEIVYDDGEYVVFAEGIDIDEWVLRKVEDLISMLKEGSREGERRV